MPSTLIIPGVQVRTQFEPSPVLPGATGVLGVVGVADRGPVEPTPLGNVAELIDQFGPASRYTMPEIRTAFANGVSRVWVSRIAPGRGRKASIVVNDADGEPCVTFVARAEGNWGNHISIGVAPVLSLNRLGAKYVDLEVRLGDEVVERIENIVADPDSPNDLFAKVNGQSRLVVAVDPVFGTDLPGTIAQTAFADADAAAATATLRRGTTDVIAVAAKRAGAAGNLLSVQLVAAPASLTLAGADGPSIVVSTRAVRTDGTQFSITVQPSGADSISLTVNPPGGAALRTYGPATSVDALVTAAAADPDVLITGAGTQLPAPVNQVDLQRRVDVIVFTEGREPRVYPSIGTNDQLVAISDPAVAFSLIGTPTPSPPSANAGTALTGGRNKGPALALGADAASAPLLELVPAPKAPALEVAVTQGTSSLDGATAVVSLDVFAGGERVESYSNLTLDPDDPQYLPDVLAARSLVVRAKDLTVRSRTSSLPQGPTTYRLAGGIAPSTDDFQDALDRLEGAEEVDLVIASVAQEFVDDPGAIRTVHQAVVAHCTKMADVARNRIGLGSVTAAEAGTVSSVLDHADDVRSDHFVLVAPAGLEAAVAGLLGHQDYFESPTFKTIASPDATPGNYTDAQLEQLILGNVAVVNERRRRGVIVVKGLLTSGMQINVRRTANKAVRDVQALAERYIGLLNNDGNRRALLQQVLALLGQMERDGALVPSTDGKDPAFAAAVYSSQNDAALGIVRIDIAVRPVRSIDYVYATILVKN